MKWTTLSLYRSIYWYFFHTISKGFTCIFEFLEFHIHSFTKVLLSGGLRGVLASLEMFRGRREAISSGPNLINKMMGLRFCGMDFSPFYFVRFLGFQVILMIWQVSSRSDQPQIPGLESISLKDKGRSLHWVLNRLPHN